jgi:hypothetical protein
MKSRKFLQGKETNEEEALYGFRGFRGSFIGTHCVFIK